MRINKILTIFACLTVSCASTDDRRNSGGGGDISDGGNGTLDDGGTTNADAGKETDAGNDTDAGNTTDGGNPPFVEADHAAPPQLTNSGPFLKDPIFVPMLVPNDPMATEILSFVTKLGTSDYWTSAVSQYGVGNATVENFGQALPPTTSTNFGDAQIRTALKTAFQNARTASKQIDWTRVVFAVFTAPDVTVTVPLSAGGSIATLCQGIGGYHSYVMLDSTTRAAYAVIPRCANFGGLSGIDMVTGAGSHELAEAVTDPYAVDVDTADNAAHTPGWALTEADAAWALTFLNENGDLCAQNPGAFFKEPTLGFTVQHLWSNSAATAGHDPCGILSTYFNTAPVLGTLNTGRVLTPGLQIAVGSQQTIELDLFSDGPTQQWSVRALDFAGLTGGQESLAFSFDKTKGKNGDKLQLTVSVTGMGQLFGQQGLAAFILFSTIGKTYTAWPVLVLTM